VGRSGAIGSLLGLVARGGIAVITSVSPYGENSVDMSLSDFTLAQKTLRGNVYGGVNVHRDIPLLLGLYRRGKLKLDELVTARYPLTDINVGYADMHAGKNLRGVVVHSH
jgi:S-(hydroxymethyl)glutathione dehydrogenase/alcohol dehydrogenase